MVSDLRRSIGALVGLFLTACALHASAQTQASAAELEAAYLYRFLSFVEWPAERFDAPAAPIVVAVAGAPELAAELRAAVLDRAAQNRPIMVRVLAPGEPPGEPHVLFVGREAASRLAELARDAMRATLLVSDVPDALARGAMIGFVESDSRLRFAVALDTAQRAGLRINSRMLAVALYVRGGRQ